MNIVIAGAGELGLHTAEVLGADGHNVVVVDTSASKLRALEDRLDVRTLVGNAAHADVLREAGAGKSDLLVAATNVDEVNLLIASVAKAIGAKKSIARIHHSAYFGRKDLAYDTHLGIDELICPEYLTALVIARTLRNPAALAVEAFAEGLIEVQELPVEEDAPAARTALLDLEFPPGVRLAQIRRDGEAEMPTATSVIQPGDVVTIVGERANIDQGRKLFTRTGGKTKNVVIMGGSAMGVWMCRALEGGSFSVRLFEIERERAEELSGKLEHITVVQADPTDPDVCAEERIGAADVFIAVTNDDEHNILASAQAKSLGVSTAIAVVQRTVYMHLLEHVGIDRAFSPRAVAAGEIRRLLDHGAVRLLATLAQGSADVYEIRPTRRAQAVGQELRNLKLPPKCMIAAIHRDQAVTVPGAEATIHYGDTVLLIGPHDIERELKKVFANK